MTEQIFLFLCAILVCGFFVLMAALFSAVLWQLAKILHEVRAILANVHAESDALAEDAATLRLRLREEGFKFKTLFDFAIGRALKKFKTPLKNNR